MTSGVVETPCVADVSGAGSKLVVSFSADVGSGGGVVLGVGGGALVDGVGVGCGVGCGVGAGGATSVFETSVAP
jgi:hypothetical protein